MHLHELPAPLPQGQFQPLGLALPFAFFGREHYLISILFENNNKIKN
jgi:hypothetical protein